LVAPADEVGRALEIMSEWAPSLVLTEVALSGGSGLELCRHIRGDRRFARTPIIIASRLASEADRIVGFESGADDYVGKPFSVRELVLRIDAVLRRRKSAAAPADERTLRAGPIEIDTEAFIVRVAGNEVTLALLEYRLLCFLVE